jgi:membrane protein
MIRVFRDAAQSWSKDNASFLGAALSYHALFSIAPLLLIAIAVAGLVFGDAASENGIVAALEDYVGQDAAHAVQAMVASMRQPHHSIWASLVGGAVLLLTAANFFLQLQTALQLIWNLPPMPTPHFLWGYLRDYLIGLIMVLLTACFWLAVLIGGSTLSYAVTWFGEHLPLRPELWHGAQLAINFILITLMLVMTWRFMSHGRIPYRKFWLGAVVTTTLFTLGRLLFELYLNYMGRHLATVFGAASAVVIFLVFVYYSAQILLFGAEVVKAQCHSPPRATT